MRPSSPISEPGERAGLGRAAAAAAGGLAAVYTAVWPHELGHAVAAFLLGCRSGWWPTGLTLWLAGSRPGGIDSACLAGRGPGAVVAVAVAGIAVNLGLAAAALAVRSACRRFAGSACWAFLLLVALANAAEATSYLVPNTISPRSDMATAIAAAGLGRLPWLAAGLATTALAAWALWEPIHETAEVLASPGLPARVWVWGFALYALAAGVAAVGSRWVFG